MTREFKKWYCSDCRDTHNFEKIADVYVTRGDDPACHKVIFMRHDTFTKFVPVVEGKYTRSWTTREQFEGVYNVEQV